MIAARRVAVGAAIAMLVVVVFAVAWSRQDSDRNPSLRAAQRPPLLLLTSLPLMFGEDFSLKGGGSPALSKLESRYRIVPISVTSDAELGKGRLLLMAQPQAQTAENLAALDAWVRRGGRVLLLADPLLEWPSKRPLGDMLRPPPVFADTGLLAHWGLRLDPPAQPRPAERQLGGFEVLTISPGRLSGGCDIGPDGLVARCRIGSGKAVIVADADLLNTGALGPGARDNLNGLLAELAALQR
jgi:uncharacterized protein DUF4350